MTKVTSSMGKIYVGDPSFAMKEKDYETFECKWNGDDEAFQINGHQIFCARTAWGDGSYMGSDCTIYNVESGCLSAIPFELVDDRYAHLGRIIECDQLYMDVNDSGKFTVKWDDGKCMLEICTDLDDMDKD